MRKLGILAILLVALVGLAAACGGGKGSDAGGEPGVLEGALPANFPDDFPMFPGLEVRRSTPLGGRYVVEASTEELAADVVAFYEEELMTGRWEILDTEESSEPKSTTLRFTAPDWPVDGRVFVTDANDDHGRTLVAIAIPIDADGGN